MNVPELAERPRSEGADSPSQRPEFFRLPKSGGDPYFGLGRSYYYEGEKAGNWYSLRLRKRGKQRGVTLVPYDLIAAYIRKQGGCDPCTATPAREAGYVRKGTRFDKIATDSTRGNGEATGGKQ